MLQRGTEISTSSAITCYQMKYELEAIISLASEFALLSAIALSKHVVSAISKLGRLGPEGFLQTWLSFEVALVNGQIQRQERAHSRPWI